VARFRRPAAEREPPGPEQALELAGHFLGTRPRTRWEVARRLRRASASDEVIEATLVRLEELSIIDDLAFARWWLEQRDRHAPRGRRLVESELRQHGIDRAVIDALRDELAAIEQAGPDAAPSADAGVPRTEEDRARAALAQHLRGRPLPDDRAALQRIGTFLVRHGFDPDAVRSALRVPEESSAEDPAGG
jgi:SOS response regulatory protein OraA/RecX